VTPTTNQCPAMLFRRQSRSVTDAVEVLLLRSYDYPVECKIHPVRSSGRTKFERGGSSNATPRETQKAAQG